MPYNQRQRYVPQTMKNKKNPRQFNRKQNAKITDARDLLISTRRNIGDAREVIKHQAITKAGGDLRGILQPRVAEHVDLRKTIKGVGSKSSVKSGYESPKLIYANEKRRGPNSAREMHMQSSDREIMVIERKRGPSLERDIERRAPTRRSRPSQGRGRHSGPSAQQYNRQHADPVLTYAPPALRDRSPLPSHRQYEEYDDRDIAFEPRTRPAALSSRSNGHRTQARPSRRNQNPPLDRMMPQSRTYERQRSPSPDVWEVEHQPSPPAARQPAARQPRREPNPVRRNPVREPSAYNETGLFAPASGMRMDREAYQPVRESTLARASQAQSGELRGYLLEVTNLSDQADESDVKELFSDIGPVLRARLVSPGRAEVYYAAKQHALEAIEKYDRRELDGVPMNIRLVNSFVSRRF